VIEPGSPRYKPETARLSHGTALEICKVDHYCRLCDMAAECYRHIIIINIAFIIILTLPLLRNVTCYSIISILKSIIFLNVSTQQSVSLYISFQYLFHIYKLVILYKFNIYH
jgi:hypothetical protein